MALPMKKSNMSQFYTLLDEFLVYLEAEFRSCKLQEDVVVIRTYRNGIKLLKSTNVRLVIESFWICIKPHISEIMKCDENYFLSADLVSFGLERDNGSLKHGLRIKELWSLNTISPQIKNEIWDCLHKLVNLASLVIDGHVIS